MRDGAAAAVARAPEPATSRVATGNAPPALVDVVLPPRFAPPDHWPPHRCPPQALPRNYSPSAVVLLVLHRAPATMPHRTAACAPVPRQATAPLPRTAVPAPSAAAMTVVAKENLLRHRPPLVPCVSALFSEPCAFGNHLCESRQYSPDESPNNVLCHSPIVLLSQNSR